MSGATNLGTQEPRSDGNMAFYGNRPEPTSLKKKTRQRAFRFDPRNPNDYEVNYKGNICDMISLGEEIKPGN